MNLKDKVYFESKTKYIPRGIKNVYSEYKNNIDYFSEQIRTAAKEALSNEILPIHAKERINDLVDLISKLKKDGVKNVTLG